MNRMLKKHLPNRIGGIAIANLLAVGVLIGVEVLRPGAQGAITGCGIAFFGFPLGWLGGFLVYSLQGPFLTDWIIPLILFSGALIGNAYLWGWAADRFIKYRQCKGKSYGEMEK